MTTNAPAKTSHKLRTCLLWLLPALAVLALALLWYARPMSFTKLSHGADPETCVAIRIYAQQGAASAPEIELTLSPEGPAFSPLLELLSDRHYRRSLADLLPQGNKRHQPQPEDMRWLILLDFPGPDGSGALQWDCFFGDLTIHRTGGGWEQRRICTLGMGQWMDDVQALILQAAGQ